MSKLADDDGTELYASGTWGDVCAIRSAAGSAPASEYRDSLDKRARAKFEAVIRMLAEKGRVTNDQKFRLLTHRDRPPVWEIKVHEGPGHRFYCIQEGNCWLITHGGPKPTRNALYSMEIKRCHDAVTRWKDRK